MKKLILIFVGVLLFSLASSLWSYSLNEDIFIYYTLNESSGEQHNESVFGVYNLSNTGGNWTTGLIGNGLQPNGTNSINAGWNLSALDQFTINFWINRTGTFPGGRKLMKQDDDWAITGSGVNDNLAITINKTSIASGGFYLGTSEWVMITTVTNNTGSTVYLNGTYIDSKTTGDLKGNSSDEFCIFSQNLPDGTCAVVVVAEQPMNIILDEFSVWNRSLTESEILSLYNSGAGETILVSYPLVEKKYPTDGLSILSTYLTFNSTITPIIGDLSNATIYIWYSNHSIFNKTTTALSGDDITNVSWNITDIDVGNYYWNVHSCDNGNRCGFSESNFTMENGFVVNSSIYDNNTYETDTEIFEFNITVPSSVINVLATLNYNGTDHQATVECEGVSCSLRSSIDIPLLSGTSPQSVDFYFQAEIYGGSNVLYTNLTSGTQNISRIFLDKCNATLGNVTLNFTSVIEGNQTRINPFYFDGTFFYWLGNGTTRKNVSISNYTAGETSLCITPKDEDFITTATIEYSYEEEGGVNVTYVPRNYYFQEATLNNITQNITLFLLDEEDATTFILEVKDNNLIAVPDALINIQRYYPGEGVFKTVQIAKTDSNGETVGFYKTEVVDYRHIITQNGTVLLSTSEGKVVGKDVPFTLTFIIGEGLDYPWSVFEDNEDISTSLTFNDTTNMFYFSYIDTSGTNTYGGLLVTKPSSSNYSETIICNVSSISSSATLTCNVTGYSGEIIAKGYVINPSTLAELLNKFISTARDVFDKTGLILAWFIILTAGMAFIWNPTAGIVAVNGAIIFTNLIGLASFNPIFIFSVLGGSIILLILLKT